MSTVRYEGAIEGEIQIFGGRVVGSGNGGPVTIQAGLVDLGGHGGPVSVIASNSKAQISSPATPGFLVIGFSPPFNAGTDSTGLALATLYDVSLRFDAGGGDITQTVTINGTNAQTFDDLISEVNLQIGSSYQDVTFTSPISPLDPTGLANDATNYTFDVQFDSQLTPQVINVTGSTAQTFGALVTVLNAAMIGGTVSIVGSSLRVQSTGTVPPVIIVVVSIGSLIGAITSNPFTGLGPIVTALGIMTNLGGALQITSNGCGGGCFGSGSNVIDNGADVQTYLFGALINFSGPTQTFNGSDDSYSQVGGSTTFIKAGDSGGTGVGGSYSGIGAGYIVLQAGNASNAILGGALNRENGGHVDIFGGNGGGGNQAVGGHVNLVGGSTGSGAVKGGSGGNITITGGNTAGDYRTFTGSAGNIALNAGNGTNGALPGDIIINPGQADGTPGFLNENFVNSPAPISGTTPSGLGPGIYDVSFTVDGGAPFTVTLSPGTNFPTFQDVVNELNSQLIGAQASILSGNINGHIHIRTNTTLSTSTIVDNDFPVYTGGNNYLFGSLNQWANSEDGPNPGTDAPGGDIHMETLNTGEVFIKGTAKIELVGGIGNSAQMTFSTANAASSSHRNVSYYTATDFTDLGTHLSPRAVSYDSIDPNLDTVTVRGSFPVTQTSAFRVIASAQNANQTEFATWHIEGGVSRAASPASTTILGANTTVQRDNGGNAATWSLTVTADTTLGGLILTMTTPAFTGANVVFAIYLEMIAGN